jgi:hypothetical protein
MTPAARAILARLAADADLCLVYRRGAWFLARSWDAASGEDVQPRSAEVLARYGYVEWFALSNVVTSFGITAKGRAAVGARVPTGGSGGAE